MANKQETSIATVHDDAKGQYAKGLETSENNGVASAKPGVITGSDDATLNNAPPGEKSAGTRIQQLS